MLSCALSTGVFPQSKASMESITQTTMPNTGHGSRRSIRRTLPSRMSSSRNSCGSIPTQDMGAGDSVVSKRSRPKIRDRLEEKSYHSLSMVLLQRRAVTTKTPSRNPTVCSRRRTMRMQRLILQLTVRQRLTAPLRKPNPRFRCTTRMPAPGKHQLIWSGPQMSLTMSTKITRMYFMLRVKSMLTSVVFQYSPARTCHCIT